MMLVPSLYPPHAGEKLHGQKNHVHGHKEQDGPHNQAVLGQGRTNGGEQRRQTELGERITDTCQRSHESHFDVSDFIGRSLILQHDQMKAGDKREKMNIGVKKLYVLLQCFLEFVIVVLVHLAEGGIKHICIAKTLIIAIVKSILQEIGPQGCLHIIFFLQLIKCHLQIQPPLLLQIRRFLCRHGKIQAVQWPYR